MPLAVSRRRLVVGVCAAASLAACASRETRAIDILFVCQAGSVKSAIARELARRRAATLGLTLNIQSRALAPADHISEALRTRLLHDGLDPSREPLLKLDAATLRAAAIVVAFDAPPASMGRADIRDWSAMPSMNEQYDRARAFLDPRVEALLSDVARRRQARNATALAAWRAP